MQIWIAANIPASQAFRGRKDRQVRWSIALLPIAILTAAVSPTGTLGKAGLRRSWRPDRNHYRDGRQSTLCPVARKKGCGCILNDHRGRRKAGTLGAPPVRCLRCRERRSAEEQTADDGIAFRVQVRDPDHDVS